MSDYQFYLANLDRKRRDALTGSDAIGYFDLCEELGVEPEDSELYNLGRAERLSGLEGIEFSEKISKEPDYQGFVKAAQNFGVRAGDLSADSNFKRKSLREYFPGNFGEDAKQDLRDYSPAQIGTIFKRVLATAKKKSSNK